MNYKRIIQSRFIYLVNCVTRFEIFFFSFRVYLKTSYGYKPIITKLSNDTFYYRSSIADVKNNINISTNKSGLTHLSLEFRDVYGRSRQKKVSSRFSTYFPTVFSIGSRKKYKENRLTTYYQVFFFSNQTCNDHKKLWWIR